MNLTLTDVLLIIANVLLLFIFLAVGGFAAI